jgi:NhaA family Na+:H+ antiporter
MLVMAIELVVGKFVGVTGAIALAGRLRIARMPAGTKATEITILGLAAGVGFTVSLIVVNIAFADGTTADAARLGVFAGSVVASALAIGVGQLMAGVRQ